MEFSIYVELLLRDDYSCLFLEETRSHSQGIVNFKLNAIVFSYLPLNSVHLSLTCLSLTASRRSDWLHRERKRQKGKWVLCVNVNNASSIAHSHCALVSRLMRILVGFVRSQLNSSTLATPGNGVGKRHLRYKLTKVCTHDAYLVSLYHLIGGRIYLFHFYDDKIAPLAVKNNTNVISTWVYECYEPASECDCTKTKEFIFLRVECMMCECACVRVCVKLLLTSPV